MTLRLDTTASTQFIPSASADTEGLVKLEAVVLQPLDAQIAAPTNSGAVTDISTTGGATVALTVPAGMTRLVVRNGGPRLVATPVGDTANLVAGGLVVFQNAVLLVPASNGVYTVTPGAALVIFAAVANVFNESPQTAPVNLWSVEIAYLFSAG